MPRTRRDSPSNIKWPTETVTHLCTVRKIKDGSTHAQSVSKNVRKCMANCAARWPGEQGFSDDFRSMAWRVWLLRHEASILEMRDAPCLRDQPQLLPVEWHLLSRLASGESVERFGVSVDPQHIAVDSTTINIWISDAAQNIPILGLSVKQRKPENIWKNFMLTADRFGLPITRSPNDVRETDDVPDVVGVIWPEAGRCLPHVGSTMQFLEDHLAETYRKDGSAATPSAVGVSPAVPLARIYTPEPIASQRGRAQSELDADVWYWTAARLHAVGTAPILRPIVVCGAPLNVAAEQIWTHIDGWLHDQDATQLAVWERGSLTVMMTKDVYRRVHASHPVMVSDLHAPPYLFPCSISAWISRFDFLEARYRQHASSSSESMRAKAAGVSSRTPCMLGVAGSYTAEEWHALEGKWVQVVVGVVQVCIGRACAGGVCETADERKAVILEAGCHMYIPHETPYRLIAVTTCLMMLRVTWDMTHIHSVEKSVSATARWTGDSHFSDFLGPLCEASAPTATFAGHWRPWEHDS